MAAIQKYRISSFERDCEEPLDAAGISNQTVRFDKKTKIITCG